MRHLAILLTLLLVPSSVLAANRTVKVRGVIGLCGTSECGIGGLSPGYSFIPRTKIALRILTVCGEGDDCEVEGVVDGKGFFVAVHNVKCIDTDVEPSVDVITSAACWLYSLNCDENNGSFYVNYVDLTSIKKIRYGGNGSWRIRFVIHGVEKFEHKSVGPGEAYLVKREGEWHFYKTKP